MAIEFHCEHCDKLIKAPEDKAGSTGRCPHCGGAAYIPRPVAEDDEYGLAPLDPTEESRRQRAAMEDAAYQRSLLRDKEPPSDAAKSTRNAAARGAAARGSTGGQPASPTSKQLSALIVRFVEAMSAGQLEAAARVAAVLAKHKSQATAVVDGMMTEDLTAYGLPALPRPVLLGFLKQLRQKL